MKRKILVFLTFLLMTFFLYRCVTPGHGADTSWVEKTRHYQQLKDEGKYEQLLKAYSREMDEVKRKGIRPRQVERAIKMMNERLYGKSQRLPKGN